jgi:ABC-2 type transport system ATP-binding protein
MDAAIITNNLTRRFGDFVAVDHLNLEVAPGQVLGYLGPNGSGKTTTIRMLLGLLHPSEGSAQVLGYNVATQPELVRANTGYMSQKFALYHELSAAENLAFYAGVYGVRDRRRVDELLDELGLAAVQDQRVQNLSAGWRQRLALATAIIHRPGLLFLDEPTSGVDPVARRAFWDLIYELSAQGITVMVSTHYMDEAEYCTQIGIMRGGNLLALAEPHVLKQQLPGKVWEINADPLLRAVELLEQQPFVHNAALASDHLRAITEPDITAAQVTACLAAEGVQTLSIAEGSATIEDVFMALSGSANAAIPDAAASPA